jgi:serine/threonine-protein kinase
MLTSEHYILLGQQIGNFDVKELLIERTASNLYLAQDVDAGRPVFLEILHPFINHNSNLALQFRRRMECVAQLEHASIAAVHEAGVSPANLIYAAIEYLPGVSLAQKLAGAETFTVVEALRFARQIAGALAVAHSAGIIHHDLRPENIIVTGGNKPLLIDLGVPVVANVPRSPVANGRTDTLDYIPPEHFRGKKPAAQGNIYSLGIILYELLAGHRPQLTTSPWDIFKNTTQTREVSLEEAREGLRPETYHLVRDCLRRQEWARHESMEQMRAAIDTAIAAEQSGAPGTAAAAPFISRRVRMAAAAGVVLLALLLLLQVNAGQPGASVPNQATAVPAGALANPTATATATAALSPTPLATPTSVPEVPVELLVPAGGSEFSGDDDMTFTPSPSPTATATLSPTLSPTPTVTPTATAPPSPTPCVISRWPTWVRYTIQRGDRLYPLALERGTLVEEIMRVNCLEDDLLTVGRVLWLPPLPAAGTPTP